MKFFFKLDALPERAVHLVPVTTDVPAQPETPPSPWLALANTSTLRIFDLDTPEGRAQLSKAIADAPLYRITLELLVDRILLHAQNSAAHAKIVRSAFLPEDPPEPVIDTMAQKYAFEGTLQFPVIASRTDLQLLDLYLKLYDPATSRIAHLMAMLGGHADRILKTCDAFIWRGQGWARLDHVIYDSDRVDHDPDATFESYVSRGRAGAEAMAISDPAALLAAWVQAERVQRELCRYIDSVLRLPDIRRLPRWVRPDVFRILEREAMKQVFAEDIVKQYSEWPELRRCRLLSDPISANAKGEVAPLIQQLLNQTLSADAQYSGSAEAFALQAERRFTEAETLLQA